MAAGAGSWRPALEYWSRMSRTARRRSTRSPRHFIRPRRWESSQATPTSSTSKTFGFVFDIDGVLLTSGTAIQGAKSALQTLHSHNIPFILLTNGGGTSEADRAAKISRILALDPPLHPDQVVQSHTPFQRLLHYTKVGPSPDESEFSPEGVRNKTVLVVGGDGGKARMVAEQYGFKNVVIPMDIYTQDKNIWPFDPQSHREPADYVRPLPLPLYQPPSRKSSPPTDETLFGKYLKIDSILVFNDSRDWGLDITLIADLLLSHKGYLGTRSTHLSLSTFQKSPFRIPQSHYREAPSLHFSNQDFEWRNAYHLPRFGQGAFMAALRGVLGGVLISRLKVHRPDEESQKEPGDGDATSKKFGNGYTAASKLTRQKLWGKPTPEAYHWAENALEIQRLRLQADSEVGAQKRENMIQAIRDTMLAKRTFVHLPGATPEDSPVMDADRADAASALSDVPRADRLRRIYMVGDNPLSDIAGANAATTLHGAQWKSVLVRTGVYTAPQPPEDGTDAQPRPGRTVELLESERSALPVALRPARIFADVRQAVEMLIKFEDHCASTEDERLARISGIDDAGKRPREDEVQTLQRAERRARAERARLREEAKGVLRPLQARFEVEAQQEKVERRTRKRGDRHERKTRRKLELEELQRVWRLRSAGLGIGEEANPLIRGIWIR